MKDRTSKQRAQTDEELLGAYRRGDTAAFAELVDRYHDDLIRFLIRLMGNRAAAEDVFQETFLQIHQSAETFDVKRRLKPWLFTIAANKGRDALRRTKRRKTLELSAPINGGGTTPGGQSFVDLMEVDVPSPDAALSAEELSDRVQMAVDQLPHALREILLLAYFQRMSYSQMAEVLDIPLGTVKSRLHSAVAAFAAKWKALSNGQKDG